MWKDFWLEIYKFEWCNQNLLFISTYKTCPQNEKNIIFYQTNDISLNLIINYVAVPVCEEYVLHRNGLTY